MKVSRPDSLHGRRATERSIAYVGYGLGTAGLFTDLGAGDHAPVLFLRGCRFGCGLVKFRVF